VVGGSGEYAPRQVEQLTGFPLVDGVLTRDNRVPEFLDRAQGQAPTALRVEEVPQVRIEASTWTG
jgi:hypothetical protein